MHQRLSSGWNPAGEGVRAVLVHMFCGHRDLAGQM